MRSTMKKTVALLLAVVLCILVPSYASDKTYDSDKNYTYYEILTKLGILPEFLSEKNPDAAISRGEFSYLIAGGLSCPLNVTERYFQDVDYSSEYAGAVMSLYSAGIVTGGADGKFYPENSLSVTDAAVITARALGYTPMAEELGGYSGGYLMTAARLGLFNGVSQNDTYLSVSDAVRLAFNMLTVDRMELSYYGGGEQKYEVKKGSSILWNNWRLKYTSGVVEKNRITSLDAIDGYQLGYLQINGEKYADPELLGETLLGYRADVLYEENEDGTKTVFLIYASNKNNTLRIDAKDITDFGGENLTYEVDEKERKVTVNFNASIIYNHIAAPNINAMQFIPAYGDILLVDYDDDKRYDVVFVNDYQTYVVYDATDDAVIDIDGNLIDFSKYPQEPVVYYNGQVSSLSQIETYDVISVCESKSKDWVTIEISRNQAVGVFSEISNEECLIGEQSVSLAGWLWDKVKAGTYKLPNLGEEVIAYLDIRGNIVHFKEALFDGMKYGYVLGISEGKAGFKDTVLRVIDHLGKTDDLLLEGKVSINQVAGYEISSLLPMLKDSNNQAKHQLIKYKKGAKNRLAEISLEETDTTITDPKRLVLSADYTQAASKPIWWSAGMIFNNLTPLTKDTVVFSVPTNVSDRTDASKYKVANYTLLQTDAPYGFKAYDAREAGVIQAVLIEGNNGVDFDVKGGICVISDIKTVLNAKEEIVLSISYILAGAQKTALTDAELSYGPSTRSTSGVTFSGTPGIAATDLLNPLTGIGDGDVVMITQSSEGTINGIFKFADASKAPDMMDGMKNPTADSFYPCVVYGTVTEINETIYTVQPEGKTTVVPFTSANSFTRYIYVDLTATDITPVKVTADYLKRCSGNHNYRVLTRCTNNAAIIDCIIYKIK